MRVNPYVPELLGVVVSLVNDRPDGPAGLEQRWLASGMPLDNPATPGDAVVVPAFLEAWEALVDEDDEPARVALLNDLLDRFARAPLVTDHDGSGWHLHYRADDASLGETLAASVSVATAEHLTRNGMHRIGRCALPECARVFADLSRPGRQRYCSHPCANRDAVRRHRRSHG
ncbi:CGNR zinc finger domain-containing protein [Pimelobacter simplex]|uniref:CGNR zinc finger domain-containing protein n=1 Tax=Nocardioides simplex TaxID=2045 RepID=UPI001C2082F8|nr:CGNR zinc finger domain-containing protein [Pimelobacter simplex]